MSEIKFSNRITRRLADTISRELGGRLIHGDAGLVELSRRMVKADAFLKWMRSTRRRHTRVRKLRCAPTDAARAACYCERRPADVNHLPGDASPADAHRRRL
ncbi:MAG: hypothetical protein U0V48_10355 [Anaerolineales bacterium]